MDELLKQFGGQGGQPGASQQGAGNPLGGLLGGGLADILGGAGGGGLGASTGVGMGGLLGGGLGVMLPALLPSVLRMLGSRSGAGDSGMHELLGGMRAKGMADVADSWVSTGQSQPIEPAQVERALGPDKLQQLSADSGVPPEQVSQGLAAILPGLVNHLTPDGQVPSAEGVEQAIGRLLGNQPGQGGA